MPTKSLRILIADAERTEALKIEKALNGLGSYRIAPLERVEALLGLCDAEVDAFDVLLISQDLANAAGLDQAQLRTDHSQFRHVHIYTHAALLAGEIETLMKSVDVSAQAPD